LFEGWGQSQSTLTPVDNCKPLATKVESAQEISGLLAGVYAAPDLATALAARPRLKPGESMITADGVWVGNGWLRVVRDSDSHAGVLARGEEIRALRERSRELADAS